MKIDGQTWLVTGTCPSLLSNHEQYLEFPRCFIFFCLFCSFISICFVSCWNLSLLALYTKQNFVTKNITRRCC